MISCNSVKFNVIDEKEDFNLLLSGKTFQTKQIRADTSHEVSALLVIFVLQKILLLSAKTFLIVQN